MNNQFEDERGDIQEKEQDINPQRIPQVQNNLLIQSIHRQNNGSRVFSINSNDIDDESFEQEQVQNDSQLQKTQNQHILLQDNQQNILNQRKDLQNPYDKFADINKRKIDPSISQKWKNLAEKIISKIPGSKSLYMPFKYNGSNFYLNGKSSLLHTILLGVLGYLSYKIVKSNFFNLMGDYQYTFVGQEWLSDNEKLKNDFSEIKLSPMMSTPFETFFFKDNLIDCSLYNALSARQKVKDYGYIGISVKREQYIYGVMSQDYEVKIPFDCEQVSSEEVRFTFNQKVAEYFFKLQDKEYTDGKLQKLELDKELEDAYNIPNDIVELGNSQFIYITGFYKYCNGDQKLFRQLKQFKRHTLNEIENVGANTSDINICTFKKYNYDQQIYFVKEIMIPEPDSQDKKMYYDYVSNNTDIFNQYNTISLFKGYDYTGTRLVFAGFNMNRYEGPKEEDGSSNKKQFDYKKAILELAALYFIVIGLFGFLIKYWLSRDFQSELAQRIVQLDEDRQSYNDQEIRLRQRQIFRSLQSMSFEEIYQIINQLDIQFNQNQTSREQILSLQVQIQEKTFQVKQLIQKKEEENLKYNQQS